MEHYDITIHKDGRYFFAIYERSANSADRTEMLYSILKGKFPESEGYKVTITKWEGTDHNFSLEVE